MDTQSTAGEIPPVPPTAPVPVVPQKPKPNYKRGTVPMAAIKQYPDVRVRVNTVKKADGSVVVGINEKNGKIIGSTVMPALTAAQFELEVIQLYGSRQYWPTGSTPWA